VEEKKEETKKAVEKEQTVDDAPEVSKTPTSNFSSFS
jgi:hypothetical protein